MFASPSSRWRQRVGGTAARAREHAPRWSARSEGTRRELPDGHSVEDGLGGRARVHRRVAALVKKPA
jgi:hypothetical protein